MESRKRARTEDGELVHSKKRAISDGHDTPIVLNGAEPDADELKDDDNLELFRKDAIYRRMKHYSREHERSQTKIADLERRRNTCEAGLAALEACWTQLLATIRSLVKPEDLPKVDIESHDLYDLTAHVSSDPDPHYIEALRNKMHATEQLVTAFVHLGGQSESGLLRDDVYRRCQEAQTECASLRAEVSLLHSKLHNMESEKDKYHEQLVAAEKRIDRLQSKTVAALNPHSAGVKEEVKDESPRDTPSSPVHSQSLANGIHSDEANEWESVAKVREGKIEELANENASMRQELFDLKLSMKYPPEELVKDNMHYKVLLIHASKLEHVISENQSEISGLKDEVESLKATRLELEEGVKAATEKATQEVRSMLVKRDNENARLREQRDQQMSELNERKQKDSVKLTSVNEIKALAESRSERIKILESEVKRLRTRLAAEANDEDLMTFLFKSTSEEVSYISDLKSRLVAADRRANASGNTPLTAIEAQEQLAEARRRLEEHESIFGKTPVDVSTLTEQLRLKESEIQKLRLLEKQRDQAEASLYTELEKLSAAWEALDRQVKGKVFDLAAMEERISKSSLEKAKSDNKFYSAMRDKEAIETERKNLARTLEKQGKLLERLSEGEKTLIARTSDLEREGKAWRQAVDKQKECSDTLEKEVQQWQKRATGERERCDKLIYAIREHEDDLRKRREDLRKAEEAVAKSKKEADKYAAKMKAMSHNHSSSANSREHDLQSEVDKCMTILKCSTCKMHMRNTVITKCMHSFCRNCVNERISSRQRKCPACNLPFSQGEVQQLYFQ